MREMTKSMLGFSWAVSLFGLQQITRMVVSPPPQPREATLAEIEQVSRAIQDQLDASAAARFRAGDEWQRRVVDVIFDAASMKPVDPARIAEVFGLRPAQSKAEI